MTREVFLLLNVALGFYNVGTIWALEVDIFRSWQHTGAAFHEIQEVHWRKLPYWVFAPVGAALLGSIALVFYRPPAVPAAPIWCAIGLQATSHLLTALFWGRWQAALSKDPLGAASPFLRKILATHWLRTALITAYAIALLVAAAA